MSAIFCDGFDTYSDIYDKWVFVPDAGSSAGPTDAHITNATSRNGGQSVRFRNLSSQWNTISRAFPPGTPHATILVHWAARRDVYISSEMYAMSLRSNNDATPQTSLILSDNGSISIKRGARNGTLIASTAAGLVPAATWVHLCWRSVLHATLGSATVWLNGALVLNATNLNTMQNTSFSTYDGILLMGMGGASGSFQAYDDLVLLNGAGSINNSYLGDVQVATLRPSGAGDRTQLLPVGSGNNWENVDELVRNGTDYNSSNVDGDGDLYNMSELPVNVGVHFVQQTSFARKSTTAAKSAANIIKVGGTEYPQAPAALGTNFAPVSNVMETNPATNGAWSSNALNSSQAGVEVRP